MRRLRRWKVDNLSLFLIVDVYYSQLEAHIKRVRTVQKLGHNPSLSARNQEQRKLLLILFYVDTGSLLTCRHIKQNQMQPPPGGCWFLAKDTPKGMGEQSEANPLPQQKDCRNTQNENQMQTPKVVADFLQRIPKQGWASKAKPIPNLIIKKKANTARWLLISCKGMTNSRIKPTSGQPLYYYLNYFCDLSVYLLTSRSELSDIKQWTVFVQHTAKRATSLLNWRHHCLQCLPPPCKTLIIK